jgi:peptidoglycan/LPS O-acetylase OafA/YrhL
VTSHTPALDGLRGIAILLVMLHHFTILQPSTAFEASFANTVLIGWCGVDLFFVLSGFLITGILIDARGSERYFSSFYARRTLRIFPLYYLVTFLALVVLPAFPYWYDLLAGAGAPQAQLPYWLYFSNFAIAARERFLHGVLDISWSLAIEEQFYLLWPAVVLLCPPRALGALCALIMLAAPLARTAALANGVDPVAVYVLPFFRADALATGALLAWLARRAPLARFSAVAAGVGVLAAAGLAAVSWRDGATWWWGTAMRHVGYSLLALTGGAMLVAALGNAQEHWWPRALSAGWLRAFGKYSYALYLFHLPVMRVVREFVMAPEQFGSVGSVLGGQFVFYLAATVPAFALAWVSWRVLERPILRAKALFPY